MYNIKSDAHNEHGTEEPNPKKARRTRGSFHPIMSFYVFSTFCLADFVLHVLQHYDFTMFIMSLV